MNKFENCGLDDKVAQTLLIPLYMKSKESRKSDPIINDKVACDLVERLAISFPFLDNAIKSSVGCAIRSRYFDQIAIKFTNKHRNTVIVNLGCGLDTRYERIEHFVDPSALFYHLDLPEVINFRQSLLTPNLSDIALKGSLFDLQWMEELKSKHPNTPFLFMIEGVLMYFEKTKVEAVLSELAQQFNDSEILFDASNTWMKNNSHRHDSVKYTGAKFELALDNSEEINQWHKKLTVLSTKYYSDFKEWRRVGILTYYFMKLIPQFRKASFIVHCKIQ